MEENNSFWEQILVYSCFVYLNILFRKTIKNKRIIFINFTLATTLLIKKELHEKLTFLSYIFVVDQLRKQELLSCPPPFYLNLKVFMFKGKYILTSSIASIIISNVITFINTIIINYNYHFNNFNLIYLFTLAILVVLV